MSKIDELKTKREPLTLDELKLLVAACDPSETPYVVWVLLTSEVVDYLLGNLSPKQRNIGAASLSKMHTQVDGNGYSSFLGLMAIDCHGQLIDGQHRLRTLRMEQRERPELAPRQLLVINLSDPEALLLDTGKSRSHADALHFVGKKIDSQIVGAMRKATGYGSSSTPSDLIVKESNKKSWCDFIEVMPSSPQTTVGGYKYKLQSFVLFELYQFMLRFGKDKLEQFIENFLDAGNEFPIVLTFKMTYMANIQRIRRAGAQIGKKARLELVGKLDYLLEKFGRGETAAPRVVLNTDWKTPQRYYLDEIEQ